ncbi:MAG: acyl-CoA dehydrogenase N-terminal domain-containing protein, partial [Variovorax sp.]
MPAYTPPLRDMQFVMHEVLNVTEELKALPKHADVDAETINAVLEEGGKFCAEVLYPLNRVGDEQGCTRHADGSVTTPAGFKEAYRQFVEGGWTNTTSDPRYGGQGLPATLGFMLSEMFSSANMSFSMYPGLSHGAYEAIRVHASDELKQAYLPKLGDGTWTGTMCLTEAHCGTDLGMLRTRAEPQADHSYSITGTKI